MRPGASGGWKTVPMSKKKVGIQLPKQAQNQTLEQRYGLELEGLAKVAERETMERK